MSNLATESKVAMGVSLSTTGTDQVRTAVRFPMVLPLRIVVGDRVLDAVTENISANGILFKGPELPALNSRIEFVITMPAAVMGTESDVSIQCIGRVIRREGVGSESLAAAIIDEYFLRI